MNQMENLSAEDEATISAALRQFALDTSLQFDDPGGGLLDLSRRLAELGWAELDMTEATMELDEGLYQEWMNALYDAGVYQAPTLEEILEAEPPAFLLVWNPERYEISDDEYDELVVDTGLGLGVRGSWSVGVRKSGIEVGDTAYLVRTNSEQGIVASGVFSSEIYEDEAFDDPRGTARYADVIWDAWLAVADRLPIEDLESRVPGVAWKRLQGSGVRVADESVVALADAWQAHLGSLERLTCDRPDESLPAKYPEGATITVTVNRYERNAAARMACLDHYGRTCSACGLDFEDVYGERGIGFMHVHHLTPLSEIDGEYEVDPVQDLRPVCPNCHAMLHRTSPPATIEELRGLLRHSSEPAD